MKTDDYWERYQEDQTFEKMTRYLKHKAWLRIEEEKKHDIN